MTKPPTPLTIDHIFPWVAPWHNQIFWITWLQALLTCFPYLYTNQVLSASFINNLPHHYYTTVLNHSSAYWFYLHECTSNHWSGTNPLRPSEEAMGTIVAGGTMQLPHLSVASGTTATVAPSDHCHKNFSVIQIQFYQITKCYTRTSYKNFHY